MAQFFTFTPKRKEDGAIDFYTLMDVFDERKEDGTTSPAGHGERKIKFNDMKVLIATEKPFAKKAVDGIKKIITDAGYEVALLEKYTDKAQLLAAVADANALTALLSLSGEYAVALPKAAALCRNARMEAAVAELDALAEPLAKAGGSIRLDLTLAGEMEYYNGLIFQGYLRPLPRPLLKGGRYDLLMQKFTPGADAIGFAVYLDELDRLSAPLPPVQQQNADQGMLNVALPKGRLGDKVYDLLARIGYGCPEDYNATRKLVVENPAAGIRYFLVKPSDVAIYVEHGAADVGIVGKDILTEASADVYELLDTGLGKCRMCVAAPADYQDDPSRPVRVATKFVNVAKSYYASMGRDIDIIKLNGSIELAPILGLSDVIVDIVETGTTLRENGLKVVTEFMPVSARFIANKASYQFKHNEMERMLTKLRAALAEQEAAK
jgi:ATP phosphoribosyltransferase